MTSRPRIDLDGVSLTAENGPAMVLALFRYRTAEGLVLVLPESADILVPWEQVEETVLDLKGGTLRVRFAASYVERQGWLRGASTLVGTWTDRLVMTASTATRLG